MENRVLGAFRNKFIHDIFPSKVNISLDIEALNRASVTGKSHQEALDQLHKEFKSYGAYKFTFDSATSPAVKQFRHKLLLAKLGSINFIVDEIGANLKANLEPLHTFLELYDLGLIKDKLTKSTQENVRFQELIGSTPANLLLFGTPSKLLDGGSIENEFYDLLEMGYARRCFFAISRKDVRLTDLTPEELYDAMSNQGQESDIFDIADKLENLANINLCNAVITANRDIGIKLLEYRRECELQASELPEHQEILKSEMSHRYFKVLKLAGAYAFLDGKLTIHEDHLNQAIKFAEDSGKALVALMNREKPYERLAKFIAYGRGKQFTQVDLVEELPYYKGTMAQKNELMSMAVAWGYTNNILIKKTITDNIEFFSGESLKETDLSKIKIAYSQFFADGYINQEIDWYTGFPKLLPLKNYHWTNHFSHDGKRSNESMIQGFNVIVLDIDGGTTLNQARELFKDYEYIIHTTKRHQVNDPETGECNDRFRMILPMNYELALSEPEFKKFMENVKQWCPFELDTQTFQRSRKWSCTENTQIFTNKGKLVDILPFIPRTTREAEFSKMQESLNSMDAVEKWFAQQMQNGNRNNQMIRFALMLLDSGLDLVAIEEKIMEFNDKLSNPLDKAEIEQTIFKTLRKKYEDKYGEF